MQRVVGFTTEIRQRFLTEINKGCRKGNEGIYNGNELGTRRKLP